MRSGLLSLIKGEIIHTINGSGMSHVSRKENVEIQIYAMILCLVLSLIGCARYHPPLLISYTQEGKEISIKKLVEGCFPSWSPDGKKIVFQDHGIWILDLETKKRTRIADAGSNPSWSPDGNKIAYVHNGIWIWEKNTSTHRHLSQTGDNPCWFPEGDSLAFNHQGIWRINIDGSDKIKLLDKGIPLSFSPDGSALLIEAWQPDSLLFYMAILNSTTHELRRLVDGTKGSFAPDGYSVIYSLDGIRIYSIIKKDSTGILLDGYDPKWSPVGDRIAFFARGSVWSIDSPYKVIKQKK